MAVQMTQKPPTVIDELGEFKRMVKTYGRRKLPIFFDTETTGLNPRSDKLVALIFKQLGMPSVVVDVRFWTPTSQLTALLQEVFDGGNLVIGHNIKFDYEFLCLQYGVELARMYDTMLAEKVIDGGYSEHREFNLEAVAEGYNIDVSKEERNWFIALDQRPEWVEDFPESQLHYMAQDVTVLEPIYEAQLEKLKKRNLNEVARLEFQVLPIVAEMEMEGIKVNVEGWRAFIERKREEARELESKVIEVFGPIIMEDRIRKYDADTAGYTAWEQARDTQIEQLRLWWKGHEDEPGYESGWGEFKTASMKAWREEHPNPGKPHLNDVINVGSTPQMMRAFDLMHIPAKSCREEDLKLLEDSYPAIRVFTKFKKKQKLVDAFGDEFLNFIDPVDGHIHTSFQQIIDTGRMSSSRPNLQQIPSRGDDGKEMRSLVIAEPGYKLVINDYPGIEDRILCYLSGDEQKRRIFDEGLDPHTETARMLFNLPEGEDVRSPRPEFNGRSYRDVAKQLNYGLMYGLSAQRLAKQLGILVETAVRVHADYFKVYSGVAKYLEKSRNAAVDDCVSRTILGRPRYYRKPEEPTWPMPNFRQAHREYQLQLARIGRQGANAVIQGTSADITKWALVLLRQRLPKEIRIMLAVHDEVILHCPDALVDYAKVILEDAMEESCARFMPGFPVPCQGAHISDHWEK